METAAYAPEMAECSSSVSDLYGNHLYGHLASKHPEKVEIDLVEWHSDPPHCLGGRIAATVGCSSLGAVTYDGLVDEISTSEIAVQNEGNTLECQPNHMQSDKKSELSLVHLAEVKVDGDVGSFDPQCIGSVLGLETDKYRTLRILVSKRLLPITNLAGAALIKAWLEIVRFHAYSWSIGLKHGDPSIWDMLYNDELKCGVLSDYDVSESGQDSLVPGIGWTIAIPFMAMDLLSEKYWRGEIARVYRHELEAFIWMLPFVFLRYQKNKPQPKTPVDSWMTPDYNSCARRKAYLYTPFSQGFDAAEECQADYIEHWLVAKYLLDWLTDIAAVIRNNRRNPNVDEDFDNVVDHWPRFVEVFERSRSNALIRLCGKLD